MKAAHRFYKEATIIEIGISYNSADLGYRRAAKVQEHVGAVLSGS